MALTHGGEPYLLYNSPTKQRIMINLTYILNKMKVASMAMLLPIIACSCSMMHEDMDGCKQELKLKFKYDKNMKFADAFSSQVKTLSLHAYNKNGEMVFAKTEAVSDIEAAGGYFTLDIKPCVYSLQVWAEGENVYDGSYKYSTKGKAEEGIENLDCKINRDGRKVDHDLNALYHGMMENVDLRMDDYGVKTFNMPLTKNTNNIKVVIQNASGKKLKASDFSFEIDDDNSWLDCYNDNIKEDSITYRPWSQYDGIVGAEKSETQVSAVVAEMTVNRLFANKNPRLKVYNNENGKLVFNIPLVDYALLVKGNYNKAMTDQDYLDRQDEYSFVFFVDDGMNWLSASIFVNSWRVVLQNVDM